MIPNGETDASIKIPLRDGHRAGNYSRWPARLTGPGRLSDHPLLRSCPVRHSQRHNHLVQPLGRYPGLRRGPQFFRGRIQSGPVPLVHDPHHRIRGFPDQDGRLPRKDVIQLHAGRTGRRNSVRLHSGVLIGRRLRRWVLWPAVLTRSWSVGEASNTPGRATSGFAPMAQDRQRPGGGRTAEVTGLMLG